ncbi:MAG: hypothetical protein RMJ56_03210 [Gemmataceae bacterium]|nr:hypothetical protein [Gemmata sp.]MDW8196597.1 hypothetical protein [Gemmataceae bacterium]
MSADSPPINLIRVFDFYVMLMFVISIVRRWAVYVDAVRILLAVRWRWPKLLARLNEHRSLILNRSFFRPVVLALAIAIAQLLASRIIFPQAILTIPQLVEEWWWIGLILVPMIPMLAVDLYFIIRIGQFDHDQTVKYLDQAESWLGWKGPLVRVVTLGYINPQRLIDEEVRKSLTEYQSSLQRSIVWVTLQMGLRLLFGLTLWSVWAVHHYVL